jgi:hypothetical protein
MTAQSVKHLWYSILTMESSFNSYEWQEIPVFSLAFRAALGPAEPPVQGLFPLGSEYKNYHSPVSSYVSLWNGDLLSTWKTYLFYFLLEL